MTIQIRRSLALLAVPATLAMTLSACGGGGSSDERPSAAKISDALQHGKIADSLGLGSASLPTKTVDCMAKVLHDSKVSNKTLKALVDGDTGYKGPNSDLKALDAAQSKLADCATAQQ